MNYVTNYYKNLSEQLQERVNVLQYRLKQLNEDNTPTASPSGIPPTGIDPRMFDPKLAPPLGLPYNLPRPKNPDPDAPFFTNERPPDNPNDGSIWRDTGGNVWIFRNGVWRCIQSRDDLPPVGSTWNPYNGDVNWPGYGDLPGGLIPDWWDQEFGNQTLGKVWQDLWKEIYEQIFGRGGAPIPRPVRPTGPPIDPSQQHLYDQNGNPIRL